MKKQTKNTKAQIDTAKQQARRAAMDRFTLGVGYTIVGLSVIGGFLMSFYPRIFGMTDSNPAIGFGIAALAGFRLWALRREMRKQEQEECGEADVPAKPKRLKQPARQAG